MSCRICNKSVSRYNKGDAEICFACRGSFESVPIWLHRLEDGEVHLSFTKEPLTETSKVVATTEGALRKRDIAMIHDVEHRAVYGDNPDYDGELGILITDIIPSLVAKALAPK